MGKPFRTRVRHFRPPLVLLCALALMFSAASIVALVTNWAGSVSAIVVYCIYACAAVFLALSVWAVVLVCREAAPRTRMLALVRKHRLIAHMMDDFSFRTVTFTRASLVSNIIFVLVKGVAGWLFGSWWLISLSAYYLVLCLAKFLLLYDSRKLDNLKNPRLRQWWEWKAYRVCGMLLLIMTLVLLGVVVLILLDGNVFTYPGTLIFVVALYDFACLITAIIFMVRTCKQHTPIIVAIKTIGFATALVSMLSLQTAMFAAFGTNSDSIDKTGMNAVTGAAICIVLLVTGIAMIVHANKKIKLLQQKNTEVSL